jgi:hypothetical protein
MMNKFQKFKESRLYKLDETTYIHGLAAVHTRMRVFIHLFNLHCKLHVDLSKSQARGADKVEKGRREKLLQDKFRLEMNICVEEPRHGGGTSTTGRVARQAFEDPEKLSRILELDFNLVYNLSALTTALSSSAMINTDEFGRLCKETSTLYDKLHPNIPKNTSMHRLLEHGEEIVKTYNLPPIFFSEEGPECKNKLYRGDKQHHARLSSRIKIMQDVYERNLAWSDPFIFASSISQRLKKKKKRTDMSPLLKKILILPANSNQEYEGDEMEEEEEIEFGDDFELSLRDNDGELEVFE